MFGVIVFDLIAARNVARVAARAAAVKNLHATHHDECFGAMEGRISLQTHETLPLFYEIIGDEI